MDRRRMRAMNLPPKLYAPKSGGRPQGKIVRSLLSHSDNDPTHMVSRRGRGQTRRLSNRTAAGAESVSIPTWGAAHWRQAYTSWPRGAGTSIRPSFTTSTAPRGHDCPALLSRSRCCIAWHIPPSPRVVESVRHGAKKQDALVFSLAALDRVVSCDQRVSHFMTKSVPPTRCQRYGSSPFAPRIQVRRCSSGHYRRSGTQVAPVSHSAERAHPQGAVQGHGTRGACDTTSSCIYNRTYEDTLQ